MYTTYEMNATGGSVTGTCPPVANEGDIWTIGVRNGPKNSPLFFLRDQDMWGWPPTYQPAGFTDSKGDVDFKGVVSADEAAGRVYRAFYLMFPNSVGGFDKSNPGYQDPTCPRVGFRNVCIAIVDIPGANAPAQ